jgi:hypothetical protein
VFRGKDRIPDRTPGSVSHRGHRRLPGSHKPLVGGSSPPTATIPQARIPGSDAGNRLVVDPTTLLGITMRRYPLRSLTVPPNGGQTRPETRVMTCRLRAPAPL